MKDLESGSIEFCGIDHGDHPDYCDAFIANANWEDGTPLTDLEIEELNEDRSYVYDLLMDYLH